VIACIQAVRGVAWVDLDVFAGLDEAALLEGFSPDDDDDDSTSNLLAVSTGLSGAATTSSAVIVRPARWERDPRTQGEILRPAQLAYLPSNVPDVLLLQEAMP
jgi:hypothetical protein